MFQEEALGHDKFWIEILLLGSIIDDGNPPWRSGPALQHPLALEHAQDSRLEIVSLGSAQRDLDFGAAGPLSLGQQRIQEGAARIGIDFDQLGPVRSKMEVVAHEDATRSEITSRDLRGPRQHGFSIGGQSGRGFDCMHDPNHPAGV